MIPHTDLTIPQSTYPLFPKNIFLLGEFKPYVNALINQLGLTQRFKPRLYSYADYILVKFYGMTCQISTTKASEDLNDYFKKHYNEHFYLSIKNFQDKKRQHRLIPHQTDVDKFIKILSEKEVHFIFGNLLTALNAEIKKRTIGGSKMRFLVDNTEYAYYGKHKPPFEVDTHRTKGTRKCRLFQVMALQGCGMTLFHEFRLLRIGQYRSLHISPSISAAKFHGF